MSARFDELKPQVFAAHPVMLRVGGRFYVRSVLDAVRGEPKVVSVPERTRRR